MHVPDGVSPDIRNMLHKVIPSFVKITGIKNIFIYLKYNYLTKKNCLPMEQVCLPLKYENKTQQNKTKSLFLVKTDSREL